jgi:hypothetical protein
MLHLIDMYPGFLPNILFPDDVTFHGSFHAKPRYLKVKLSLTISDYEI